MSPSEPDDLAVIEQALRVVFRQARNPRFQDLVRVRAGVDLDRAAYGVLVRVGEFGPVRLSALAGHVGVDTSTVSRQVQQLEQRGLVVRRRDPADGRAALLELSDEGRDVAEQLREAWLATVAEVLVDFSPDEIGRFAGLLDRFAEALRGVGADE